MIAKCLYLIYHSSKEKNEYEQISRELEDVERRKKGESKRTCRRYQITTVIHQQDGAWTNGSFRRISH